uniref:Protein quiver n=1 Tax=Cacopsylla melanoneura TaxID=428564 RepID=A0A8D9BNI4_9HEMI
MGFTFPVYLISLILLVREVFCLRCYLCNSYDQQHRQGGWNETCNRLTPWKQLEQCPKLGTHCFTICSIDSRRNQRYIRRGCTSQKNLCSKFQNPVKKGLQVECNVCSYDNCNHLNACEPEWEDHELDYATGKIIYRV